MNDPNVLFKLLAQQQALISRGQSAPSTSTASSSTANATAAPSTNGNGNQAAAAAAAMMALMAAGGGGNGTMTPEMMMWQTVLAQAQLMHMQQNQQQQQRQQHQKQQQQQRQQQKAALAAQTAVQEALVKFMMQQSTTKNGKIKTNGAPLKISANVNSTTDGESSSKEPGEVGKTPTPKKTASASTSATATATVTASKNLLDNAMWQMLAAQLAKQQQKASSSTTPAETTDSTRSATPEDGAAGPAVKGAKRPPPTEAQARIPMGLGWKRQTCVRQVTPSGVRGEVVYLAPCGKKLATYAEVQRYLAKHPTDAITRDNFTFSTKLLVGEFVIPKPTQGTEKEFVTVPGEEMQLYITAMSAARQQQQQQAQQLKSEAKKKEKSPSPVDVIENLNDEYVDDAAGPSGVHTGEDGKKEIMEDLFLGEAKPLPVFERVENQCLDGNGFADALMVHEFVHNFGHVLQIDLTTVPSLGDLCAGLCGDKRHFSATMHLAHSLFRLTLEYPGIPASKRATSRFGQPAVSMKLTRQNFSELLRFFLSSKGKHGKELCEHLDNQDFDTIAGEKKASILAFLCNELLGCQNIVREIDASLEEVQSLRGEKWLRDGKIRALQRAGQRKEHDGSESEGSRPTTPEMRRNIPGLGQCEVLTEEETKLSVEQLEQMVGHLQVESQQLNQKIHSANLRIRAVPFGCDRYHRNYWLLSNTQGVLVESIESAGRNNPACNVTDTCNKDPEELPGTAGLDDDVIAVMENLVDEVVLTRAHADKKTRRRYRRMHNGVKRGWWTVQSKDTLENLRATLATRGIRERCLQRILTKDWFLKDLKFDKVTLTSVGSTVEPSELEENNWQRLSEAVQQLKKRCATANILTAAVDVDVVDESEWGKMDVKTPIDRDGVRRSIIALRDVINPVYLRRSFTESTLPLSEDGEAGMTVSVEQDWKEYVLHGDATAGQLALAIGFLEDSIKWERLPREGLCQICKVTEGDEMILCDGCESGYHMECFKPEMKKVPDGDWFCPRCRSENLEKSICVMCCRVAAPNVNMLQCQRCDVYMHHECAGEHAKDPVFVCTFCMEVKTRHGKRAVIVRGGSEDREVVEEEVEEVKSETRKKRKAADPSPFVPSMDMNQELCRVMLNELEEQPTVGPFLEPVDPTLVPDYLDVIENPIDLQTIRNRAESQQYESPEDFAADMEQMFSNCRKFNDDDSPVGLAGISLQKFYHKRFRQLKYNFAKRLKRVRH